MFKKSTFSNKEISMEQAIEELEDICIGKVGIEYRVMGGSDDGGSHIKVYLELEENQGLPEIAKKELASPYKGWRVIKLMCPIGYLEAFYPLSS